MLVRLVIAWIDPYGVAHSAGELVDIDAVTLAELEEQEVVENVNGGPTESGWVGPGAPTPDGWVGPGSPEPDVPEPDKWVGPGVAADDEDPAAEDDK